MAKESRRQHRVSGDNLARLVHMMGTRAPASPAPGATVSRTPGAEPDSPRSLLERLRSAPVRVRCFGAREVWHRDRLLEIADPQLLRLLGVHPVTGIRSEKLVDMLWDKLPADVARALRKERFDLRGELRRQVPELLRLARTLEPAAAIVAYGAALALYHGDLLDSSDVPNYRWMYDVEPQVGLTLRSDFRRRNNEARLRLAKLLAMGPESGLGRAEELYSGLCAEDLEDERLWIALFRIHERTGSSLGLEGAVRRYRGARSSLAPPRSPT